MGACSGRLGRREQRHNVLERARISAIVDGVAPGDGTKPQQLVLRHANGIAGICVHQTGAFIGNVIAEKLISGVLINVKGIEASYESEKG